MSDPMNEKTFDSVEYWRNRHDQYKSDARGVGNVGLDADENERIYARSARVLENLMRYLEFRVGAKALDLGCGIGKMVSGFTNAGLHYTGIDISETALELARKGYPDSEFLMANIAKLPLDGPFDVVMERTVFIHLVEDEYWNSVLAEVARVLASDGVFILQDMIPISEADRDRKVPHVSHRTYGEYKTALANVGLKFDDDSRAKALEAVPWLSPNTHLVRHV